MKDPILQFNGGRCLDWGGGNDRSYDDFYQVESPEHADKLTSEYGGLFFRYKGPGRAE